MTDRNESPTHTPGEVLPKTPDLHDGWPEAEFERKGELTLKMYETHAGDNADVYRCTRHIRDCYTELDAKDKLINDLLRDTLKAENAELHSRIAGLRGKVVGKDVEIEALRCDRDAALAEAEKLRGALKTAHKVFGAESDKLKALALTLEAKPQPDEGTVVKLLQDALIESRDRHQENVDESKREPVKAENMKACLYSLWRCIKISGVAVLEINEALAQADAKSAKEGV